MSLIAPRRWLVLTLCALTLVCEAGQTVHARQSDNDADFVELTERPLRIPLVVAGDTCPRSDTNPIAAGREAALGSGPVYLTLGQGGLMQFHPADLQDGLYTTRVVWAVAPDIRSPILIRGQQINGPNGVRFAYEGEATLDILRLGAAPDVSLADAENDWRFAESSLGVNGPGCYVLQADGPYFSASIVFEVTVK